MAMIKMIRSVLAKNKLRLVLVAGSLLVIGAFQLFILIEQFHLNVVTSQVSLSGYFSYLSLAMISIIVTLLIWIELDHLEEFHLDKFTFITFILGCLLRPRIGIAGERYLSVSILSCGVLIALAWVIKKPASPRTDWRWTLLGILTGGASAILIVLFGSYLRYALFLSPLLRNSLFPTALGLIIREFSSGVAFEEILFRGFLWGYLRRLGMEKNKAIWIQGFLFWFLHFGSVLAFPFRYFLVIPLVSLVSSKLTSYSKQTFPSILSHTTINIIGGLLNLASY